MRARIKFTTDFNEDFIVAILKDNHWWPHYAQDSSQAKALIEEIKNSVDVEDVELFMESRKFVLSHTGTEARGTLSHEHNVWVLRILNPSIHLLQLACEVFAGQISDIASQTQRKMKFEGPVQIVERQKKETIIEGVVLSSRKSRMEYAMSQKSMELGIAIVGGIVFLLLLLITYPWSYRNFLPHSPETWIISIFEKLIGSVVVTTLISYFQFRAFFSSLKENTIKWSIPGKPETHEIKANT